MFSKQEKRFDKLEANLSKIKVELSGVKDTVNGLKADFYETPSRRELEKLFPPTHPRLRKYIY
jgi:hypothetical protein